MLSNGNTSSGNTRPNAGDFRPDTDTGAKKRLEGWHLLVVDDDADVRDLLVKLIIDLPADDDDVRHGLPS